MGAEVVVHEDDECYMVIGYVVLLYASFDF